MLLRDRECGVDKVGIKAEMGKNRTFFGDIYSDENKVIHKPIRYREVESGSVEFP